MIPFASPTDDILFSLGAVARAERLDNWDADLAQEILTQFGRFAEAELAPLNAVGDQQGCRLENGRVRMPDGFAAAYTALAENGWQSLAAPEEFGGMDISPVIASGVFEVFSGANHSMQMVCNLVPGAIATLKRFGTDAQKAEWIPRLAAGEVLSTMCLTEAGAGSDLSRIRCRAVRDGDDWKIEGQKIFISGGDQDMSEGIFHLVLARSGSEEDGLRGLSLFICPSHVDGVRNAITVSRIEEKLGLHASPTCQMEFDGAKAQLIGPEGAGLKAMFTMMNHARLDVSLQGVAHATRAHQIASAYAADRKQGRKPDGSPAVLSDHADVRRMLDRQRALALGARAMVHLTFVEMELGQNPDLVDFLTPICKFFGTEAGLESADLGIQILGGYGYLQEYGVEQIWRDARITKIYEGANGIHAMGLATRALRVNDGAGPAAFADLIRDLAQGDAAVLDLLTLWTAEKDAMLGNPNPGEGAHDFMVLTGRVLFRAAWVRIGAVAACHPDGAALTRLAGVVTRM
jgi:alkylation response protein AidB-like acyl-CoA dehydrogenase